MRERHSHLAPDLLRVIGRQGLLRSVTCDAPLLGLRDDEEKAFQDGASPLDVFLRRLRNCEFQIITPHAIVDTRFVVTCYTLALPEHFLGITRQPRLLNCGACGACQIHADPEPLLQSALRRFLRHTIGGTVMLVAPFPIGRWVNLSSIDPRPHMHLGRHCCLAGRNCGLT